jgi:L-2,4-diaminobutyric acid acetyltransferase
MDGLVYRRPELKDGKDIHSLVRDSKPLDCNSLYSYLLLTDHFDETCIVAEYNGRIAGYISAYIHPKKSDTLFIWQVAVSGVVRCRGIASSMIMSLLCRDNLESVRYLETTVTPSNTGSSQLFESVSRKLNANIEKTGYFPEQLFGADAHEQEVLFRIGPFTKHS